MLSAVAQRGGEEDGARELVGGGAWDLRAPNVVCAVIDKPDDVSASHGDRSAGQNMLNPHTAVGGSALSMPGHVLRRQLCLIRVPCDSTVIHYLWGT